MANKYTYNIQSNSNINKFGWINIMECNLNYGKGYMDCYRYQAPRSGMRLVRSDGKVIEELSENEEVSIGQVAGWATPEQYERASENALIKARSIRLQQEKQKEFDERRKHK